MYLLSLIEIQDAELNFDYFSYVLEKNIMQNSVNNILCI
jgi:hypothetical protein